MSTTAPAQVDPTAVDLTGISVATSPPSDNNLRTGSAFDPASFAAAAPVWFHPTPAGDHLVLSARTWSASTPGGGAGTYASYDESTTPSWFTLHGPTGASGPVPGYGTAIPVNTKVDSLSLVAGASRAPAYLWLLHAATIAGDPAALLQLHRVGAGGVSIYTEEVVPTLDAVVFDKGLRYDTPYLHLYGTDSNGAIFEVRKKWGEIGTTKRQSSGYMPTWEYQTGTGYSTDPGQARPHPTLTTVGPLSFAAFRDTVLVSTVTKGASVSTLPNVAFSGSGTLTNTGPATNDEYVGTVWESRRGRPFKATTTVVPLGTDDDGSYLGHGLSLQPQLEPNPAALNGGSAGIPYLVTTKVTNGPDSALSNAWGLHTMRW